MVVNPSMNQSPEQSEGVTGAWAYAKQFWGTSQGRYSMNMDEIWWVAIDIMVRTLLTNQSPVQSEEIRQAWPYAKEL
jgi:hypothetical protein